jgi:hypothetical protein
LANDVENLNDLELIGAADAARILTGKTRRISSPETIVGWIVLDRTFDTRDFRNVTTIASRTRIIESYENEKYKSNLREFDTVGIKNDEPENTTLSEEQTSTHFEQTVHYKGGQYHTRIHWENDRYRLETTDNITTKRLRITTLKPRRPQRLLELNEARLKDNLGYELVCGDSETIEIGNETLSTTSPRKKKRQFKHENYAQPSTSSAYWSKTLINDTDESSSRRECTKRRILLNPFWSSMKLIRNFKT